MKAMVLNGIRQPLQLREVGKPSITGTQVLVEVEACAVCRTDLHIVDGELPHPALPLVPGHQVIGQIVECGKAVHGMHVGDRVGIPWLGQTCGICLYCQSQRENLCDNPQFTGYTIDGGFAEYASADARYCFRVPETVPAGHLAPLLCAGLIGYRCLRMAGDAQRLGIYGFGAAAHIVTQLAVQQGRRIFAFTSPGDAKAQRFARRLGAEWTSDSLSDPPEALEAAIIFAPVGSLVPRALRNLRKGGSVICGGIHMSDIPQFPYADLWGERQIRSVTNLTRLDGREFFSFLESFPVQTETVSYPLDGANDALNDLKEGRITGVAVLHP